MQVARPLYVRVGSIDSGRLSDAAYLLSVDRGLVKGATVNSEQVDAFFSLAGKKLPAEPAWRSTTRLNEYRARLPIEAAGKLSGVELELVVQFRQTDSLVIVLLAPSCIARLCLGKPHLDRRSRTLVFDAHFHGWDANRPKGPSLPTEIPNYELLADLVRNRDEAVAWFLKKIGIESPAWVPVKWPDSEAFV